ECAGTVPDPLADGGGIDEYTEAAVAAWAASYPPGVCASLPLGGGEPVTGPAAAGLARLLGRDGHIGDVSAVADALHPSRFPGSATAKGLTDEQRAAVRIGLWLARHPGSGCALRRWTRGEPGGRDGFLSRQSV